MQGTEDIIRKGHAAWKANRNLAVPHILNALLQALLLAAALLASWFLVLKQFTPPEGLKEGFSTAAILSLALLALIYVLASVLVSSYFSAGAIGMAAETLGKGKSRLEDMYGFGIGRVTDLFLVNLLLLAFTLVLLVPTFGLSLLVLMADPSSGSMEYGIYGFILFSLILAIATAAVPYAIVLDRAGPIEGVKASLRFLHREKVEYILVWICSFFTSIVVTYAAGIAAAVTFSAGALLVPLPAWREISPQVYPGELFTGMLAPLSIVLWASSGIFVLACVVLSAAVTLPLQNLWWTAFYKEKGGLN